MRPILRRLEMSFFTNNNRDCGPGRISGNPMNGLCEKVCVQAKRVFDACIKQTQEEGITLVLTNLVPPAPTYPLTFVSARSTSTQGTISNLQVDRLPDRPHFARVRATITIPMEVLYTDANGVEGKADSSVSFDEDVILYIPDPSIIPYGVEAVVSVASPEGVYTATDTFTVTCCFTIILKIVMEVELLVPTYGYATIPQCQEYTQEVCSGFFDLPVFPNS